MKKSFSVRLICFLALCGVLNIIGGTAALFLRLPVYLDTIGTILAAAVAGPFWGMLPGCLSALIGFLTTDPFALYYLPVQLAIGAVAGLIFGTIRQRKVLLPLGVFALTLPGTIISSVITVQLFGGITSSGSSLLVQLFSKLGLNLTASVVLVQFLTDYLDRFLTTAAICMLLSAIPKTLFGEITSGKSLKTRK